MMMIFNTYNNNTFQCLNTVVIGNHLYWKPFLSNHFQKEVNSPPLLGNSSQVVSSEDLPLVLPSKGGRMSSLLFRLLKQKKQSKPFYRRAEKAVS